MKAQYDGNWIADDDKPMFGLTINGQRIIQEANPVRAARAALFARGNLSQTITFSTTRSFATVKAAQNWMVLENQTRVKSGTLVLRLGAFGDTTEDATITGAKLQGVAVSHRGVDVTATYTFRYTQVAGIVPSPAEDPLVTGGTFDISNAVDTETVTGLALVDVPSQILLTVRKPADGSLFITAMVDTASITTDGFTFYLSGVTDSASYKLDYLLII